MAYLEKSKVKIVRDTLKKEFPGLKFSVQNDKSTLLKVVIVKGNVDFDTTYQQIRRPDSGILKQIWDIMNVGNYDRSDIMSDYFDVGFYVSLNIGRWDVPYILTNK